MEKIPVNPNIFNSLGLEPTDFDLEHIEYLPESRLKEYDVKYLQVSTPRDSMDSLMYALHIDIQEKNRGLLKDLFKEIDNLRSKDFGEQELRCSAVKCEPIIIDHLSRIKPSAQIQAELYMAKLLSIKYLPCRKESNDV